MGIKEEMEGDIAPAANEARARATVSVRKKAADTDVVLKHEHGNGMCDQAYIDDEGRRRITRVQGRIPLYSANCKACIADDKRRMSEPPPDLDFDSTVFLIPEGAPDSEVAQAYLAKRYPGQELAALDTVRPARLAIRKGVVLVVVTRRVAPGQKFVGPKHKLVEDKFGNLIETAVPPEEYISEIVESAPINVDECVTATAATMFSDAIVDLTELNARLCDVAAPRYYCAQYQRVVNSDEIVFTMRRLG